MFCTRCGNTIPEGSAFCTTSGTPVQAAQPAPPPAPVYQAPPPPPAPVYQPPPAPVYQAPAPPPGTVYQGPPPQQGQVWAPPTQPIAAVDLPYARFWTRFWAYLIDSLIVGAACTIVIVIVFLMIGGGALLSSSANPQDFIAGLTGATIALVVFAYFALIAIVWLYFAKMESSDKQATFGKKAMGIYVTDMNGQRLTFGRATGRFFAKIVTGMVPFFIGYIMAAYTAKRQAVHDYIASTLVMRRQ